MSICVCVCEREKIHTILHQKETILMYVNFENKIFKNGGRSSLGLGEVPEDRLLHSTLLGVESALSKLRHSARWWGVGGLFSCKKKARLTLRKRENGGEKNTRNLGKCF